MIGYRQATISIQSGAIRYLSGSLGPRSWKHQVYHVRVLAQITGFPHIPHRGNFTPSSLDTPKSRHESTSHGNKLLQSIAACTMASLVPYPDSRNWILWWASARLQTIFTLDKLLVLLGTTPLHYVPDALTLFAQILLTRDFCACSGKFCRDFGSQ